MPKTIEKADFVPKNGTVKYKPTHSITSSGAFHPALQRGVFTYYDIEAMRREPQCQMGLRMLRAPIFRAEWEIKCKDQRAAQWADATLRRFWTRDLTKALKLIEWGAAGGENVYRVDEDTGHIEYESLRDFHLMDMRALENKEGKQAGIKVFGQQTRKIFAPRFSWWTNEQEFGLYYGRPRLAGAFEPWMELRGKKGGVDVRRGWYFKSAYRNSILRYPMGSFQDDQTGATRSNEQYAHQIMEEWETGAGMTMPTMFDGEGNDLWRLDDAKMNGSGADLLEYIKELNREILIGMGIPPEVIQASETGSGWSGRSVPFLTFLTSEDEIVFVCIMGFKTNTLDHLMQVNWGIGPDDYEITIKSLVPKDEDGGAAGQPGEGGPEQGKPQGQPPQPGQPGQPQPKTGGSPQAIMGAQGPVKMSAAHAPKGGVTVQGTTFKGGEFIPGEVMDKATPEERAAVGQGASGTEQPEPKPSATEIKTVEDLHAHAEKTAEAIVKKGILQKIGAPGRWLKNKTKALYNAMEARYGRATAIGIFAAGHVAGLATPLAVVPGSTLIGMAPFAALAEVYLQAKRGIKKAKAAVGLSTAHAPKGGITIQGKPFTGGEFIPGDVLAKASDEEKAKVVTKAAPKSRKPAASKTKTPLYEQRHANTTGRSGIHNDKFKPAMTPEEMRNRQGMLGIRGDLGTDVSLGNHLLHGIEAMQERVKQAGGKMAMPSQIKIGVPKAAGQGMAQLAYDSRENIIYVSPELMEHVGRHLGKANDYYSVDDPFQTLAHEFAHVQHRDVKMSYDKFGEFDKPENKAIARNVSRYASTSPDDFIAETYAGLMLGRTFDEKTMALYGMMGGIGLDGKKPENEIGKIKPHVPPEAPPPKKTGMFGWLKKAVGLSAEFDESKVKRDHGKFASKPGASGKKPGKERKKGMLETLHSIVPHDEGFAAAKENMGGEDIYPDTPGLFEALEVSYALGDMPDDDFAKVRAHLKEMGWHEPYPDTRAGYWEWKPNSYAHFDRVKEGGD